MRCGQEFMDDAPSGIAMNGGMIGGFSAAATGDLNFLWISAGFALVTEFMKPSETGGQVLFAALGSAIGFGLFHVLEGVMVEPQPKLDPNLIYA